MEELKDDIAIIKSKLKIKDDLTAIRMAMRYTPAYWDYDTSLLYKPVSRFEFIANAIWLLGLNTIPIDDSKVKIKDIIPLFIHSCVQLFEHFSGSSE